MANAYYAHVNNCSQYTMRDFNILGTMSNKRDVI